MNAVCVFSQCSGTVLTCLILWTKVPTLIQVALIFTQVLALSTTSITIASRSYPPPMRCAAM